MIYVGSPQSHRKFAAANGKVEVTVGEKVYVFSPESLKPVLKKKLGEAHDESFDEVACKGCVFRWVAGQIQMSIFDENGYNSINETVPYEDLRAAADDA